METPPRNLQDLENLVLLFLCEISHKTLRGLVEDMWRTYGGQLKSMPRRFRAVLAAEWHDFYSTWL